MKKGSHHSEVTKEKLRLSRLANPNLGQFKKGHVGYKTKPWEGKTFSDEHKQHISEGLVGRIPWNAGKTGVKTSDKGHTAWNKDTHIQLNTGKTHFKKGQTPWNKDLPPEEQPGYKNPEDRVTPLNEQIRHSDIYIEWRDWIFEWDNYTCQKCGEYGGVLRAHHIKQFADIVEKNNIKSLEEAIMCKELFDVGNGITYCEDCHDLLKNKGGLL